MHGRSVPDFPNRVFFSRFTYTVAGVLAGTAVAMVYAWWADYQPILHLFPGMATLRINTSIALLLSGTALALANVDRMAPWRVREMAVKLLGCAVIVIGALTLWAYATGSDLGLDRLFMPGASDPAEFAGRMSIPSALCSVMAGFAFLMLEYRTRDGHYPAEYFAVLMVAVMSVPLVGYLFSVSAMVHVASKQDIPPHVAMLFMFLAAGLLTARPDHRIMALWNSDGPGAALVRKLLPKSVAFLIVLDLLADRGARIGLYGHETVPPLVVLLASIWLSVLFWRAGSLLNREHDERRQREAALSETSSLLRAVSDNTPEAIYVKDADGVLVFANPATARMLGHGEGGIVGMSSDRLFSNVEDAGLVERNDRAVLTEGRPHAIEETLHLPGGVRTLYSTRAPWLNERGELLGLVGISTDITERKRVEDALREHETHLERLVSERTAEVSELIGHLESTREEEKRAIARELHDDLGSALTALSMHLAILFQKMPPDPALTERSLQIKALLSSVTQTTRRIQVGLRPDKLDIFGIKTAIAEQCLEFENYTGVVCKADLPDEDVSFSPPTEIALYRMLQESLNNIAKHAQATRVDVGLDDTDEGVTLSVRDNGVGFVAASSSKRVTHGLRGMRERAQYLGGDIRINSTPGKGTSVMIRLPKTHGPDSSSHGEQRAQEAG